jgi:hypothetical protein
VARRRKGQDRPQAAKPHLLPLPSAAMDVMIVRSVLLFLLAGLCEIGGGYLVWLWLRDDRAIWLSALGGLILFLYGVLPTL